jgi:hypothetical protein
MFKQNLKPPLGASNTLKIVENGLEMRKLWPPKVKGVKNSEKNHLTLQRLKHLESSFYVVFLLLKSKHDL